MLAFRLISKMLEKNVATANITAVTNSLLPASQWNLCVTSYHALLQHGFASALLLYYASVTTISQDQRTYLIYR